MPNRILRDGILTSSKLAQLNWAEEVLYRRLMSVVDDFGRYFADPGILLGHLYPRQLKKVSESDVGKWLAGVQAAGLVRVYPASGGEHYLELLNFGQQVRAQKSKYPAPPAPASNCSQTKADALVFGDESVDEDEDEDDKGVEADPAEGFDAFWNAYPSTTRKAAKAQCLEKWKARGLALLNANIVAHVTSMAASEQWMKDKGQFVPAPLVYLNQSRWEAPTEAESVAAQTADSWHESVKGIVTKGIELGVGEWTEALWAAGKQPDWLAYRSRVFRAAGYVPRAAA